MSKSQELIWDEIYKENKDKWKLETPLPKIFKNKSVLELGAGNGKTLKSIIAQSPLSISAIDFSQQSITILKNRFPKVNSIKSDILSIPFPDSSFDIVICSFVLNNLTSSDLPKAVSEISRVLNKKGKILFVDFAQGDYRLKERRQDGLSINGFSIPQIKKLFSKFSIQKLRLDVTNPIRANPELERKRIFMLAHKN
ncbi:MAG: class I SAM-dependent methyltransferase [Nanoarchaeota archaeon]